MNAIKLYNKEKNTVATIQTETNDINQTFTLKEGNNLKLVGTITSNVRLRVGPNSKFKNLKDAIFHALEYNRTSNKIYIDIDNNYVWEELELKGVDLNNIEIVPPSNFLDVKSNARFCINLYSVRNFICNNLKLDLKQRTKTGLYRTFLFTQETTARLQYLNVKGEIDSVVSARNDICFIDMHEKSSLYANNMTLNLTYNITDMDDYLSSQIFIRNSMSSKLWLDNSNITVTLNRSGTSSFRKTRLINTGGQSNTTMGTTNITFSSNKAEFSVIDSTGLSRVSMTNCVLNLQNYINNSALQASYGGVLDTGRGNIVNIKDESIKPATVNYSGLIDIRTVRFNPVPTSKSTIPLNTNTIDGIIYG